MVIGRLGIPQQLLTHIAELHLRRRGLHTVNIVARSQSRVLRLRLLLLMLLLPEQLMVTGGLREERAAEPIGTLGLLKNLTTCRTLLAGYGTRAGSKGVCMCSYMRLVNLSLIGPFLGAV